jgi:hypothetical protein
MEVAERAGRQVAKPVYLRHPEATARACNS